MADQTQRHLSAHLCRWRRARTHLIQHGILAHRPLEIRRRDYAPLPHKLLHQPCRRGRLQRTQLLLLPHRKAAWRRRIWTQCGRGGIHIQRRRLLPHHHAHRRGRETHWHLQPLPSCGSRDHGLLTRTEDGAEPQGGRVCNRCAQRRLHQAAQCGLWHPIAQNLHRTRGKRTERRRHRSAHRQHQGRNGGTVGSARHWRMGGMENAEG